MSVETEVASRSGAGQDLRVRVAVALGLIALVALSLAFRKEAFVGVAMLAAGMSLWELAAAFARKGLRLPVAPLLVGSIGIVLTAYLAGAEAMLVATILTAGAVVVWRVLDGGGPAALRDAAAGVFAAAYIPFLIGFVMLMLAAPDGVARIIVFLLLPIAVDTGGYFAGTRFGRHPMAPSVSPKKSWEGLAGSVLLATVVGAVAVAGAFDLAPLVGAGLGLVVVATAALGDLAESLLKRDLGVKDMGSLLPGHGGLLDRIDSMLLSAPLVQLILAVAVPVASS